MSYNTIIGAYNMSMTFSQTVWEADTYRDAMHSIRSTLMERTREGGDIELFITLVLKVLC